MAKSHINTGYNPIEIPSKLFRFVSVYGIRDTIGTIFSYFEYQFHRIFLKNLIRKRIHSYEMYLDSRDPGLSRELLLRGDREQQLRELIFEELHEGDVVLDLGANIGYYALMMASIIKNNGKIYALEPSPKNVELLVKNIKLNHLSTDLIEVFPFAGSNKDSTEKLFISKFSNLNTMIPKDLKLDRITPGTSDHFIEVKSVKLSNFLKDKRKISFLRMDIEGYEVEVLQGLREAIQSGTFSGKICFEVHTPKYDHNLRNMESELNFLIENGYVIKTLTSSRDENSNLRKLGYQPYKVVRTRAAETRGFYSNVKTSDALRLVCESGGIRDILLTRN